VYILRSKLFSKESLRLTTATSLGGIFTDAKAGKAAARAFPNLRHIGIWPPAFVSSAVP